MATARRPQTLKNIHSLTAEGAYGSAVSDGVINKMFPLMEANLAEVEGTFEDDAELINGMEFPQDTQFDLRTARDATIPVVMPASPETLAWLLTMAMGTTTVSGSGPYTHTITALDPTAASDQLPSTSIVQMEEGLAGSYKKYKGCIPNEVRLTIDSRGKSQVSSTFFTDGVISDVASHSVPSTYETMNPCFGQNLVFKIADAGSSAATVSNLIKSFEFQWNNNFSRDDDRAQIDNGLNLNGLRFGNRQCTATVVLFGDKTDTYWDKFEADTFQNIEILITGTNSTTTTFKFTRCKFIQARDRFDDIRNVTEFAIKPYTTTTTSVTPCTVVIVNNIAAYLV